MMRAMYSAVSGLKNHQTMLDVVANDLANVNTLGFKSDRVTFADQLYQLQRGATAAPAPQPVQGGQNAAQVGLGVQLGSIDHMMDTGAIQSTGQPLDVAITRQRLVPRRGLDRHHQPGLHRSSTACSTRSAGNFTRDSSGNLVTTAGDVVVGQGVTAGGTPNGVGSADQHPDRRDEHRDRPERPGLLRRPDGRACRRNAGFLTLATFPNQEGLERAGGSNWITSAASGTETVGTPNTGGFASVMSGAVEMSNVDMASEFTNMITAQRGFEANSRSDQRGRRDPPEPRQHRPLADR